MLADIILILIMLLCIFLGYSRGLIKVAVKIIGFFAALIIALIFYTPVSNYIIENTDVVLNLEEVIESKLYDKKEVENEEVKNTDIFTSIENYTDNVRQEGAEYLAKNVAISIVRVRNMDRTICNSKASNDIYKAICKCNRKNTNYQTI